MSENAFDLSPEQHNYRVSTIIFSLIIVLFLKTHPGTLTQVLTTIQSFNFVSVEQRDARMYKIQTLFITDHLSMLKTLLT